MRLLKLKSIRKSKGKSQEQVARELNIPVGTFRNWEQLKYSPRSNELILLADYFDCSVDDLMGRTELPDGAIGVKVAKGVWIPVYGSISAGTPMEMIETKYQAEAPETIIRNHPNAFWLRVRGDSMNKEVLDGSLVMIDPDEPIQNGITVAVNINGYDAALKVFHKTANTIILSPHSTNPEHKDIVIDETNPAADEIRIIGSVIWAMYPHPDMISLDLDESA